MPVLTSRVKMLRLTATKAHLRVSALLQLRCCWRRRLAAATAAASSSVALATAAAAYAIGGAKTGARCEQAGGERQTPPSESLRFFRPTLCLNAAGRIVDASLQLRRSKQVLPLAVVVLDAAGGLVCAKREDGCAIMRIDIAMGKAWGALSMGMPTRQLRDRLSSRPSFIGALSDIGNRVGKGFVPVPGGVLILDADRFVVGAIGISGDTSDKDEMVAIEAIIMVSRQLQLELAPDPAAPSEAWTSSSLSH